MARIAAGLIDQIWAETPASADDVITPPDARQVTGWNNAYFQPGGSLPEGEHFNALWNRQTAFGYDVQRHGVLEWSADQDYEHPAAVLADNNHLYLSTQDSGPNFTGGAVNPTGATGSTRWRLAGSSNQFVPAAQVTGTNNRILLAPDPPVLVYDESLTLIFRAEGTSDAGVVVNVSGLGDVSLHFSDAQAGAGDIVQGFYYVIRYDGTNLIIVGESGFHILPVARGGTGVGSIADLLASLNIGNRLMPDGGTSGQVLAKQSAGNYDADWTDVAASGITTLTEGDHIEITGAGDSREIAVETGTTAGDLAELGTGGRFAPARVPMIEDLDGTLGAADVPELQDLRGTLDIANGGTGSTTAATARSALGLGSAAVEDVGTTQGDLAALQASGLFDPDRIPPLQNLNGTLDVASGGTGATNQADAQTNLGISADAFRNIILSADTDVGDSEELLTVQSFEFSDYRWLEVLARLQDGGRVTGKFPTGDLLQNFPQTITGPETGYAINNTNKALYRVNVADGTAERVHPTNTLGGANSAWWGAASIGQVVYAIDAFGNQGRDALYVVNVNAGTSTRVHATNTLLPTNQSFASAFVRNGSLYAINDTNKALYEIDVTDGTASRVHANNTLTNVSWGASFSVGGVAYGIGRSGVNQDVLYEIDVTNGTSSRVHATNFLGTLDAHGAFDVNGVAYLTNDQNDRLNIIDVTDGTSTPVNASNTLGTGDWEAGFSVALDETIQAPREGLEMAGARLALWRETGDALTRLRAILNDGRGDVTIEQLVAVA